MIKLNPFLFLLSVLGSYAAQAGLVVNGDFTNGLTAWESSGDVTAASGQATLGETFLNTETESYLYQGVPLNAGSYRLSFDFSGAMSSDGQIPDLFSASLYYANTPPLDPIANIGIIGSAKLFDLDWFGETLYSDLSNAAIGPSSKGGNWRQFSGSFSVLGGYAIPTFELLNLSGLDVSSVDITNVSIDPTSIDEPDTLWLIGAGLLAGIRHRKVKEWTDANW